MEELVLVQGTRRPPTTGGVDDDADPASPVALNLLPSQPQFRVDLRLTHTYTFILVPRHI